MHTAPDTPKFTPRELLPNPVPKFRRATHACVLVDVSAGRL
ncbi:hypothetical protein ACFY9Q_12240 [Streptomyces sp. NPDC012389]